MLLPLNALRDDKFGIMKAWSDGGYSDDLIMASHCFGTPPSNTLALHLLSFLSGWMAIIVLNHAMLGILAYVSWAVIAPSLDCCGAAYAAGYRVGTTAHPEPFLFSLAAAVFSLRWMTETGVKLLQSMDPASNEHLTPELFNWFKVWGAFFVAYALMPVCIIITWLHPHVVWSGVKYEKRKGRVVRVLHPQSTHLPYADVVPLTAAGND
eukprot:jgi/Botrbrau1/2946/Bobra.0026s0017.1